MLTPQTTWHTNLGINNNGSSPKHHLQPFPWRLHNAYMMQPWCGNAFHITDISQGIQPVTVISLYKKPVIQGFNDFWHVWLNKMWNKKSNCRWFETSWPPYDVTLQISLQANHKYYMVLGYWAWCGQKTLKSQNFTTPPTPYLLFDCFTKIIMFELL